MSARVELLELFTWPDAVEWRAECRRQQRVVVFTNGVFDLLHSGHVSYLTVARNLGEAPIVGENTDASARALKGPTRPVTSAQLLAELQSY